jgi:dihydroneopterin aldolase
VNAPDRVILKDMAFFGHHGFLERERREGQVFLVTIDAGLDLRTAGASDELDDTVDYRRLFDAARTVVEGSPCNLLEAVAERIAEAALREVRVRDVRVEVRKPHADLGGALAFAAVRITRDRNLP